MPGVGEIPVQCPQAADEALRVGGDRLGHVAAGRGDRADDRHRALPSPAGADPSGPLVERGQGGGQAGRVPLLGRKLAVARRELAQRLRPARGGVRDHHHVQSHVPEVLRDRGGAVDAGLARHHRHVGGVRDDHGPVGQPAPGRADRSSSASSPSMSASSLPRSPQPTYTITSASHHFVICCSSTVLPVPNPPGTAQLPPLATGNSTSTTRCPVSSGGPRVEPSPVRPRPPHRPGRGHARPPCPRRSRSPRRRLRARPRVPSPPAPLSAGRHQHPVPDPAGHGHRPQAGALADGRLPSPPPG